jgi:hypothetical protein
VVPKSMKYHVLTKFQMLQRQREGHRVMILAMKSLQRSVGEEKNVSVSISTEVSAFHR